jgi:hypothetical protein
VQVEDLALSANNHFGIKCHTGWDGDSKHDDDSLSRMFLENTTPGESFKDLCFFWSRNRYAKLFYFV